MKKIYILDGYNLIYRMFFAIKGVSLSDGSPINAVFGIVKLLHQFATRDKPDELYFVIDPPGGNFREALYSEYKAQRSSMPEELRLQEPLLWKLLAAMNIPVLVVPQYEADDVMATLATTFAKDENNDIYICTGDKDLYQFVGERVAILDGMKQIIAREAETIEKFGVPPHLVRDYLAICGDSSDNIPGIPGFGPKKAQLLLNGFGDLDEIYRKIDEVPSKLVPTLEACKDIAYLSRKLATIDLKTPVVYQRDQHIFGIQNFLHHEALELLQTWNFKTIVEKLPTVPSEKLPPTQTTLEVVQLGELDFDAFFERLMQQPKVSCEILEDCIYVRYSTDIGYSLARGEEVDRCLRAFLLHYKGSLVSYSLKALYKFLG